MPIDPSIALGVKPVQIESPINQMAKVYEMQNAVQSNQLNQMKMDEYARGVAEAEQFKNALAQANDETAIRNAFYAKGDVKGYNDYLKSLAEQQKLALETTNLGYTGKETQGKVAKQKQEFNAQAFRNISQNPSNENIIAWGQDAVINGHYTQEEANGIVNQLTSMPVAQRQAFLASQGASAGELKPDIRAQDLGGTATIVSTPAFGGAPTTVLSSKKTLAPGEAERIGLDRQRVGLERQRLTLGERRDVVANTVTDAAGNVSQFNKFGEKIGSMPGVGKPSATFEKTKAAKQQMSLDLDSAIKDLTEATKAGGLIETATGSYLGQLRDMGARVYGGTTEGAVALGALQPIYDKVLKMVPRFEGPQSDKDTASYNRAAGDLGNPSQSTAVKLAAAKTILRLMKDRKAQFRTIDMIEADATGGAAENVDANNPLLN